MKTTATCVVSYKELRELRLKRKINNILRGFDGCTKKILRYLTKSDKKLMIDYDRFLAANGKSLNTRSNALNTIKRFLKHTKTPLEKTTRDELESFMAHLTENMKKSTKSVMGWGIRSFFEWATERKKIKPVDVSWIKFKKVKFDKPKFQPLTKEEICKMGQVAKTIRDQALILTFYESQARRGDFLSLAIKDVEIQGDIAYLHNIGAVGKTGKRDVSIPVKACVPSLKLWLNSHPYKENLDAPLFIRFQRQGCIALSIGGLDSVLKLTAKRAGINKPIYSHLMRQTRTTHLVKEGYPQEMIRQLGGWSHNSSSLKRYFNISEKDIHTFFKKKHGLLSDEELKKMEAEGKALNPIKCEYCGTDNPPYNSFCQKEGCGKALTVKAVAKEMEKEKRRKEDYLKIALRMGEKGIDISKPKVQKDSNMRKLIKEEILKMKEAKEIE